MRNGTRAERVILIRMRVVEAAANSIREDVRSMVYNFEK